MITENQERLSLLTQSIHKKLEQAAEEIETQAEKSHSNHKELVDDLVVLQDMAKVIFERIGKILLFLSYNACLLNF